MISIFHARSREKRLTDLSSLLPSLPRTSYKRFLSTIDLSMRDALVDFDVCYREQDLNNLFPYVLKIFICQFVKDDTYYTNGETIPSALYVAVTMYYRCYRYFIDIIFFLQYINDIVKIADEEMTRVPIISYSKLLSM